jgi:chaperonin GroES
MTLRPLQDRVLVRGLEPENKTAGGILIPDTATVGPGARSEDGKIHPLDVKVGDHVLFGKWSGTEIKLDGEDVFIMKEADIMGIVVRDAASTRKAA